MVAGKKSLMKIVDGGHQDEAKSFAVNSENAVCETISNDAGLGMLHG